jgi:multidrug efflux pump subunit AcrB
VLSFDVQTANTWFGQMVVVTKGGIAARDRAKAQFETYLKKTFPGTDTFVKLLEVGPPVGRPVQYRLSGPDIAKVREFSQNLAGIVRANPHLDHVVFDWMEPARVVKVDVLQDKARQLGVSSEDIATTLNGVLAGSSITQVRDSIYLVNVTGRATAPERASIDTLRDLQLTGLGGQSVPLGAVATLRYEIEQPTIWRRSRLPTITLKASILDTVQPKTVVDQLAPKVTEFAKGLPAGYSVAIGGSVEESAKSQAPIEAVVPLMLFIMATILMIQLQSFHRLFLVFAVAPLALIGVVMALLPSGAPLGFVALATAEGHFITPTIVGRRITLNPLLVFLALAFWTWLWGPAGLLLATPLTVCVVVIGRHVPNLTFLQVLLSDEPVLPPRDEPVPNQQVKCSCCHGNQSR